MQIIGAGFGRTGTTSLKAALEQLGFGPCYHMQEVLKQPRHAQTWLAAAAGNPVDWHTFLGDYQAGLDFPFCHFYQELLTAFPDAKVLLSVRDPERWYDSTLETVYASSRTPRWLGYLFPPLGPLLEIPNTILWNGLFDGRFSDRSYAIEVFQQHIEEVKATVPPEKLLIFNVKEGWEPLCRFLERPIPAQPFPHLNDRAQMQRMRRMVVRINRWEQNRINIKKVALITGGREVGLLQRGMDVTIIGCPPAKGRRQRLAPIDRQRWRAVHAGRSFADASSIAH